MASNWKSTRADFRNGSNPAVAKRLGDVRFSSGRRHLLLRLTGLIRAISGPHTIRILRKRKRAAAKLRARGLPLQLDPSSFEGLELTGKISRLVRIALQARGIERLDDLERISLADLLRLPNIGRRSATTLIDLYAERKRSHKGRRADQ